MRSLSVETQFEMYKAVLAERRHLIDHAIEVHDEDGNHIVHVDEQNRALVCVDVDSTGNFWHLRFPVPALN